MRTWEKWLFAAGMWVFLAAVINALDGRMLPALTAAMLAAGLMVILFGRARDRRWRHDQKESAALLARLEESERAQAAPPIYVKTKEGFYVRADDI